MTTEIMVTITVSFCALTINVLLGIGTVLSGNLTKKLYRYFFIGLIMNIIQCVCEIVTALIVGTPGVAIARMFWIVDFANYASGGLNCIFFSFYIHEYISMNTTISFRPFLAIIALSVANILLMSGELFYPIYGYLDENNYYIPTDAIWVTSILPILCVLLVFTCVVWSAKALKLREWLSLLLYTLLPVLCYGIELAIPGIWITPIGNAVAFFFIYSNIQMELKSKVQEQDAELTESRIAMMLSQIQPHFLYNSLSAIENLCEIDAGSAKTAINDFAHYLRGNLDSINQRELIHFEDELEHVETYVGLEKLRFGDKLQIAYAIETENFMLPPLTVQPIVENAIRYGVTPKNEGGTVSITVKEKDSAICILVEDDGLGFNPNEMKQDGRAHIGIDNVRARLERLCGGSLEIQSTIGQGTSAIITVPKLKGAQ